MVIQKSIKETGTNNLKRNVKVGGGIGLEEVDILPLASHQEVLALQLIQSQFLGEAGKQVNQILFQKRKTKVDHSSMSCALVDLNKKCAHNLINECSKD